jgi:hypothetical protein
VTIYVHIWTYLAQFFLECFRQNLYIISKHKFYAHFYNIVPCIVLIVPCIVLIFIISCRVWDNVEIYCRAGRPQVTIRRMRIACWIPKATNTHSYLLIFHCNNGGANTPVCTLCLHCLSCLFFEIRSMNLFLHFRECGFLVKNSRDRR